MKSRFLNFIIDFNYFFQSHDDCPTCRQAIANSFKTQELKALDNKVAECKHGLNQLEEDLISTNVLPSDMFMG